MAIITVTGAGRHSDTFYELKRLTEWMAVRIAGPRLAKALIIRVKYYDTMDVEDSHRRDGRFVASCQPLQMHPYPRKFEIQLSSVLGSTPYLRARYIAHEMKHMEQFARGRLYDYVYGEHRRWKRKKYQLDVAERASSVVKYKQIPWEKEADSVEIPLAREWIKHERRQSYEN